MSFWVKRRTLSHRRGAAVLPLVLAMVGVSIGMGALMVDLGYILAEKSRLQSAADAASMAGALRLRSQHKDPHLGDVRALAIQFAELNQPEAGHVLSNADIDVGVWDHESSTFAKARGVPKWNSVRVTVRRNGNQSSAITLFFASIFGKDNHSLEVVSVCAFEIGEDDDGERTMSRPFLVR